MTKKSVHVVIALIQYRSQILLGWRDEHLHQGGCYEFPGGKVETHESALAAVRREVLEEVGVGLQNPRLFERKSFDYGDKLLCLDFFIAQITEQDRAKISAPWQWVELKELRKYTFPAANQSIIDRLVWSKILCISQDSTDLSWQLPVSSLCYLRKFYKDVIEIKKDLDILQDQKIASILNLNFFDQLAAADQQKVFAIHVNSKQLKQINLRQRYPDQQLIAACHDEEDILLAQQQQCDAIFISPIQPTQSHPQQTPLGWHRLKQWAILANMPVYALGGLSPEDVEQAEQYHAYGVAGIRNFFQAKSEE